MDFEQIKTLMQEFGESDISRMKLTKDGFEMELEKAVIASAPVVTPAPMPAAAPAPAPVETSVGAPAAASLPAGAEHILSPMVGTFYAAPSPDSAPFAKKGDTVKKGQIIAILEAMKIMNEIETEFDCRILEILINDGQAVEYDMPLFVVERV